MPAMADITVLNSAAANVVYVAATPSAGDKSPARWTQNAAHSIIGFRPMYEVMTRDNGSKNGRIFNASLLFPVIGLVDGIDTKLATVPFRLEVTIPTNVDSAKVYDACVQGGNLAVSTLIRSVFSSGYAPT